MDQRIRELESTTFGGRRFTRKQLASIQDTVRAFPSLSLRELAHTICELLQWQTPNGQNKVQACLGVLEKLQSAGLVSLPDKDRSKRRGRQRALQLSSRTEAAPVVDAALAQLMPVRLEVVADEEATGRWNEYVERYHYLGYRHPIGPSLRYFIVDQSGRELGCLMFSYAAKSLACRDAWIGWQDQAHKKHLDLVVNNNRFLLFPWVRVKNLASKALSLAARQLGDDWHARHGYRPVLLETFVDLSRYTATSYRAANWLYLGLSEGRGGGGAHRGKTPKAVFVYPLRKDAKARLLSPRAREPERSTPRRRAGAPKVLRSGDPFVQLWQDIITTMVRVAEQFDRQWQQRRRVLNTLLVMLFVFRLVFSKDKQGYASTIAELWEQCRVIGVELPQAAPVSASALCTARAKLDEQAFKQLHRRILAEHHAVEQPRRWLGHRLFAVDASKLNLPVQLRTAGYRRQSSNAHYPQGLVSCLYELKSKLPIDFELFSQLDELSAARTHLSSLRHNDVVVYDRGYFSYLVLHEHVYRDLHPVFRMRRKARRVVDQFFLSEDNDTIVEITPTQLGRQKLGELYPGCQCPPLSLRLVKYTVADSTYVLGTTLFDSDQYPIEQLAQIYHARWGIEELYKVSKQLMTVEQFHGQTERGVKQELYAHYILIALARIFSNHSEDELNPRDGADGRAPMQVNFKNCLTTLARNIEALLIEQAARVCETVNRVIATISRCRQKLRPGRSYARRSRKPRPKWQSSNASGRRLGSLAVTQN